MATSSIFHNFTIKSKKDALNFLKALEEAEKDAKNRKNVNVEYKEIKDKEEIIKMFGKKES